MKIIQDIKNNIYSPEYYNTIKDESFGKALKYFSKIILIPAILFTVIATVFIFTTLTVLRDDSSTKGIINQYPEELQVTIKSGQISTNVTEPYKIPLTSDVSSSTKNLIIIDTNIAPSIDQFAAYNTQVLVSKEYIIYKEDNGKISVQSIKDWPDMVIDRGTISGFVDKVFKYLPLIIPLLVIFIFFGIFVAYAVANLFFILILTLITWIIQKIRKDGMPYSTLFKVGMHAVTLPILLEVLFLIIGINIPIYVSILVFIAIVISNIKKVPNI